MKRLSILLIAAAAFVGCSPNPGTSSAEAPPPPTDAGRAEIALRLVPPIDIDGAIKMQRGKIVVVDIWATWCVPCKQEFPHLVELHQKRAKDGVVCMSVAWDSADDRDKAVEFLQQRGATFPNFLLNKDDKDGTQKWLDAYDIGPIPVVLVFGRDGKLAKKFDREDPDHPFTYADVNRLVEELLKKS